MGNPHVLAIVQKCRRARELVVRRELIVVIGVVLQPLLAAVALPLLTAPTWLAMTLYLALLVAVGIGFTKPVLKCLDSVSSEAEASMAENRLRKIRADLEVASLLEARVWGLA